MVWQERLIESLRVDYVTVVAQEVAEVQQLIFWLCC